MISKIKEFLKSLNEKGIYIPLIRDPRTGPSVSLTLMFLSFNIWIISIVGKWSGALGGVDPSQTLAMFGTTAALYFGRKFQKDEKGSITLEADPSKTPENK
jgi:hypothetical protein